MIFKKNVNALKKITGKIHYFQEIFNLKILYKEKHFERKKIVENCYQQNCSIEWKKRLLQDSKELKIKSKSTFILSVRVKAH